MHLTLFLILNDHTPRMKQTLHQVSNNSHPQQHNRPLLHAQPQHHQPNPNKRKVPKHIQNQNRLWVHPVALPLLQLLRCVLPHPNQWLLEWRRAHDARPTSEFTQFLWRFFWVFFAFRFWGYSFMGFTRGLLWFWSVLIVKISLKIVLVMKTKLNLLLNTSILWELCARVGY